MRHLLNLHFKNDIQINIICALINVVNVIKVKALLVKLIIERLKVLFFEVFKLVQMNSNAILQGKIHVVAKQRK